MTRTQQLYRLIAECQAMTRQELLTFTGWPGAVVDHATCCLVRGKAIRRQNIDGGRFYVIA